MLLVVKVIYFVSEKSLTDDREEFKTRERKKSREKTRVMISIITLNIRLNPLTSVNIKELFHIILLFFYNIY